MSKEAEKFGRVAEAIAESLLRMKFYYILERRYKTKLGEVDIIAKRGSTLVFIEVKARKTKYDALSSLTMTQRKRIENASKTFLARNPEYNGYDIRFDLIIITPYGLPEHLTNAWITEGEW